MDINRVSIIKLAVILFALIATFFMGKNSVKPTTPTEVNRVVYDTITRTIIKRDTMWRDRIVYRDMPVVVKECDTLRIVDTIKVAIPIYNYHFKDDLYDIKAEGYDVTIKSVTVYPRTEYRTERIEVKHKWGLGVQVGYGASKDGLSPYIGIGVSYNIFSW